MNENRFQELKERIRNRAAGYECENIADYVSRLDEEERASIIQEADLILKQTVVFRDLYGRETGRGVHRRDEEMWIHYYETEPQWTYELNRHDFLYKLLYAYLLTGEQAYAVKLRWCIFDWMIKSPIALSGTPTTRPEDTGIRCLNWCGLILQMIESQVIDEEDTVVYLQNMAMQFEYLKRKYVGSNTICSIGVAQTAAMCAAYLWFDDFLVREDKLEQWAWGELRRQLELQVLEDGSHREELWHKYTADEDHEDLRQGSWAAGQASIRVLDVCEKLLLHCQNAAQAGVQLCEEAKEAMMPKIGWLWKTVEKMIMRLYYLADGEGYYQSRIKTGLQLLGIEEDMDKPSCLQNAQSGMVYLCSKWSDEADRTWIRRRASRKFDKILDFGAPYVREQNGCSYVEMSTAGVTRDDKTVLQRSKMLVLPGGIWIMDSNLAGVELQQNAEVIQAAEVSEHHAWTLDDGEVCMQIDPVKNLQRKYLDDSQLVILAPEEVEIKRAAVFRFGRPAPVSKDLVTALDVKGLSGDTWTVVLWKEPICNGNQMFLCHGAPICGEVEILRGKDGRFERILWKN